MNRQRKRDLPGVIGTTNVKPSQLNYDEYAPARYDRDIANSVPFHREVHELVAGFISKEYGGSRRPQILDLGVGTGLTSSTIRGVLPAARFDVVDFSRKMLRGARERLGSNNVRYILGDYSRLQFDRRYDIVVSVIGMHHQTDEGKRVLFKKIHSLMTSSHP